MASCYYSKGPGKHGGKAVVAMDCEMARCLPDEQWIEWRRRLHPRKKIPNNVSIAVRCAIVDYRGRLLYDKIIRPNQKVVDYLTVITGVSKEDMTAATWFDVARSEVDEILQNKIVVGHAVKNDFASLLMTFPPEDIRDTADSWLLRKRASTELSYPMASLKDLAAAILGITVQKELPHDPSVDAKVALDLYKVVEDEWESAIEESMGW